MITFLAAYWTYLFIVFLMMVVVHLLLTGPHFFTLMGAHGEGIFIAIPAWLIMLALLVGSLIGAVAHLVI